MRKIALLLLLFAPATLLSQGTSPGSSFLKIPNISRIGALGESQTADPGNFSSSFLNPANMAMSVHPEILFSHTEWIQDVQNDFLAVTLPLAPGRLGIGIMSTHIRGIEVREVPGPPVATVTARSAALQLLYALSLSEDLSVGANAKYLYEKIYVDEATGYSLDLGIVYRISPEGLSLGASVSNLGSLSKFRSVGSDLPSQFQLGGSYAVPESDFDIIASASFVRELNANVNRINLGSEACYDKTFFVRLGYQTGFESRNVTGGLGFRYIFATLDYAYIPFSLGLGNVHIFSLGFEL